MTGCEVLQTEYETIKLTVMDTRKVMETEGGATRFCLLLQRAQLVLNVSLVTKLLKKTLVQSLLTSSAIDSLTDSTVSRQAKP